MSPRAAAAGRRAPSLKCMDGRLRLVPVAVGAGLAVLACWFPAAAAADGPTTPIATSYQARVTSLPAGLHAKVVDGYLQLWLQAPPSETVIVLDTNRAPWVRFDRAGVQVNESSVMYYLSQTPIAETPPPGLKRTTPPHWLAVSSGHSYMWRDGRLHAFATVAIAPGTRYVGPWRVALLVDGHPAAIAGALYHANAPPIVWFWPVLVALACVLAAWRLRRPALDARLARAIALALLAAITLAAAGHELHGRPDVGPGQLVVLALALGCVAYAAARVLGGEPGYFLLFAIAFASLWAGGILVPTLLHPFVLMAIPPFLARAATVVCLGGGLGLILLSLRMLGQTGGARGRRGRRRGANGARRAAGQQAVASPRA
jgi:hypothetical protein